MGNSVSNLPIWFLALAPWVFLLVIIYGSVKYVLARGNEGKEPKVGKMFLYGIVVLFVLSFLFVVLIPFDPPLIH